MSAPENNDSNDDQELVGKLRAIRERIRRRLARPALMPPELRLPPLDPLQDARIAASNLAGAIGTLNPRPPGLINDLLQTGKRSLARLVEWAVRPQRDFNRAVVESLARTSEVLEATNRNLLALAEAMGRSGDMHRQTGEEMDSLEVNLEAKLEANFDEKMQLQQDRTAEKMKLQEDRTAEQMNLQQLANDGALARHSTALQNSTYMHLNDLQGRIWKAMENIQEETRVLRQRLAAQSRAESVRLTGEAPAAGAKVSTASPVEMDYFQLQRHFRGTEADIRTRQSFYLPFFEGRRNVLDIACGRGEFLELMRQAKVTARGVDLDSGMVGQCLQKGLNVVQSDAFSYLETVPDGSLDGIFCAQFVEHLEAEAYVRLVSRCAGKLAPSGILVVETPNPECLAIFSQTFFLDPTHVRPIPPALMRLLFAEAGLARITAHFLSPAAAGLPVIPQLASGLTEPDKLQAWNAAVMRFNETFFGGMDYALIGYRPGSLSAGSSDSGKETL